MCFLLLQEYIFMCDAAYLDKILDVGEWESLYRPKFFPHIVPLGMIGVASAESSVLQTRLYVHLSYVLEEDDSSFITGKILSPLLTSAF